MKKRWWVLGTVAVIGIGGALTDGEEINDLDAVVEETTAVVDVTEEVIEEPTEPEVEETTPEPEPEPTPAPTPTTTGPPEETVVAAEDVPDGDLAIDVLETLEVKGRAPKTGYDRDQFGQRWADINRNGCDTRNDILDRDLTGKTYKPGTRDCVVLTGTLISPFTAETISFVRGESTSSEVQIDHVVALSDAWQKGAQQLSLDDRERFANDPLNLLAVDGSSNAQKGDGDAATWLPKNKSFRCEYVARQVSVKAKYNLWVTSAEKTAISNILGNCPGQLIPEPSGIAPTLDPADVQPAIEAAPTTPVAEPTTNPAPAAPAEEVYYANCSEAKAAGAAPLYKDDPGYRERMDGDRDGIACE